MSDPGPLNPFLTALSSRLMDARTALAAPATGFAYPLDASTLPEGRDGDPAAVLATLSAALGPSLVIQAGDPVVSAGTLVLDGQSAALGGGRLLKTTLTFDVGGDGRLRATWAVTPDADWALPDAFPTLAEGPWDSLPLTGVTLLCTTYDRAGLSMWATLPIDPGLRSGSAHDPLQVRVGGPITVGPDGTPAFAFTGERAVDALEITRTGQTSLRLSDGTVTLTATTMRIAGRVRLGALTLDAVVDVPTGRDTRLRLTATPVRDGAIGARDALALFGESGVPAAWLPATLLDLAGAQVTGYDLLFDPYGQDPSQATLTLGFGTTPWTPVNGLAVTVSAPTLTLTVRRTAGLLGYQAALSGTLLVRERPYACSAEVDEHGLWWFTVSGDTPGVRTLAELAGFTETKALAALPDSLRGLGDLRFPARIAIAIDPVEPALVEVWFQLAQTKPWPIAGGAVTVSGWTADVEISRHTGTWTITGLLAGTIRLRDTPVNVRLPLPAGEGDLWTFSLAEPVTLPTLGQALALLGARPQGLPTALDTLGGLTVTAFSVSADLAATAIQGMSIAAEQAEDWVIASGLTVSGVRFALSFSATEAVAGAVSGVVVLAGQPVDAAIRRNQGDGPWTLWIARTDGVHVPGFASLDTWLGPGVLPSGVPDGPFGGGLDVEDAYVRFGGPGGTIDEVGVAVRTADQWNVVAGKVPLTSLRAALKVPYPISAETVHGEVAAVVTVGGVPIGISAEKPPGGDWELSGDLLDGLTIDVVAAANTVGSGFALPSAGVTHGLPATLSVRRATVRAVPVTGRFRFSGNLALQAWPVTVGGASLLLAGLTVTIEVPARGVPPTADIGGTLDYAGIHATLRLRLGGTDKALVLDGTVTDAQPVSLPGVTGGLAPTATAWAQTMPPGAPPLAFGGSAVLRLDVPGSRFLLYGSVRYGTATTADALVYTEGADVYALALSIGPAFRFGGLVPALAPVDDVLHVTEARVVVCAAGGRTLGALAAATNAILTELAPTGPRPLAGLDTAALALEAGAYFSARIDFAQPGVLARVLDIGDPGGPHPTVRVTAEVDRANPANTVFSAELPTITLLSRVEFAGLTLTYKGSDGHRFTLDGRIRLLNLTADPLTFAVALTVNDTGMIGEAASQQEIVSPLGLPGITLSALTLEVAYRWEPRSTRLVLRGGMKVGPAPAAGQQDARPTLTGSLVLRDGAPVLFHVTLAADLSIGAFLAQCVTGSGSSWPTGYADVTLLTGTRISSYDAAADTGGLYAAGATPPFENGFTVVGGLRLTLAEQLTLTGLIRVYREETGDQSYTAVKADLTLPSAVVLGPATLTGSTLVLRTGRNPRLSLTTAVTFLGAPFVTAEVTVRRGHDGGTVLSGTLAATGGVAPFDTARFTLNYATHPSRPAGLTVDGWPRMAWPQELIDIVQIIKGLCGKGGSPCGQLTETVQSLVDTTFHVTPSATLSGTTLLFSLTGTYDLTARGATSPFVSVELPTLSVPMSTSARWEELPDVLASGVAAGFEEVVKALLRTPEKAALLLAIAFGPQALAVGLKMACDSLVDGAVAAAADAAASAILAAGGVTAAGAAAAATAKVADSLRESAGHTVPDSGGPVGPVLVKSLTYGSGNFIVTWDAARGATGYEVEVRAPSGGLLAPTAQLTGQLTAAIPVRVEAIGPGVHQARVRALRQSLTGEWTSIGVSLLDPPQITLAFLNGPAALVYWQASQGAAAYELVINDDKGQVAHIRKTSELKAAPLLTRRDGRLWVQVRAFAGEGMGPWSEPYLVADQRPPR